MNDFAKIFRAADGHQVLYIKDNGDNVEPVLRVMTMVDGVAVSMTFGFPDTDDGLTGRDGIFDELDQSSAERARALVLQEMSSGSAS